MSEYYEEWAPYVSVAERRAQAERELAKLRKKGHAVEPVTVASGAIAKTFWGKSWCRNLESYRDFAYRLERGRQYVRHGAVLDLKVAPLAVTALVSGSSVYKVTASIAALPKPHWRSICRDCAGGIDSLVELLRGRFSKPVMERLCRQQMGLFPNPSQIKFSCTCPDHASMCKHVAAALYAVGARLDEKPELLFLLRDVDQNDLLTNLDTGSLPRVAPAAEKILADGDLSALFGLDMEIAGAPRPVAKKPRAQPDPTPAKLVKMPAKSSRARKPEKPASAPAATVKPPLAKPVKPLAKLSKRAKPDAPKPPAQTALAAKIALHELLMAYEFASVDGGFANQAFVSAKTGKTYVKSDILEDFEPIPADLETSDEYLCVPSKQQLKLGRELVFAFVKEKMPKDWGTVQEIFGRRGAYARFRSLLLSRRKLDAWYSFEAARTEQALRDWCEANGLQLSTTSKP